MSVSFAQPPAPTSRRSQLGEPAWELAYCYPAQGDWSEEDYLELSQKHRVELVDGCIEVLPMATIFHQLLADYLHSLLKGYLTSAAPPEHRRGRALFAPLPVRLASRRFRDPDVIYLRPERLKELHGQPDGADLVVEIVSEGKENRDRDLVTKRAEYAAAGIEEYWIVDPESRSVTVLMLDRATRSQYHEHGVFAMGSVATSVLLPGFAVDVTDLFAQADGAAD
ncbi:MAG: Uma2 family endonuclease [Planctomycetaceae bacterium]|nr:Uma2 family endonuclease [Planctomycetaceae bacterium]